MCPHVSYCQAPWLSCHVKTMHGLNNIIDVDYIARIAKKKGEIQKKKWLCMNKLTATSLSRSLNWGLGMFNMSIRLPNGLCGYGRSVWAWAADCGLWALDCGLCAHGWSLICCETADSAIVHSVASSLF